MTDTNIARAHVKFLDELSKLSKSELLKSGNLQAIGTVYRSINAAYISLCEQSSGLPYMPSAKSDMLFNRYVKAGDLANARKIVENRLVDITTYIKRI